MGRRKKVNDTSDSPAAQRTNKRVRTSTPTFRLARESAVSNRTSRVTTIKKNALGRRGYQTDDRHLIYESLDLEGLPGEAVPNSPLPDGPGLEQLDYELELPDPETVIPPQSPKPKRKRQNTTSVCVLTSVCLN